MSSTCHELRDLYISTRSKRGSRDEAKALRQKYHAAAHALLEEKGFTVIQAMHTSYPNDTPYLSYRYVKSPFNNHDMSFCVETYYHECNETTLDIEMKMIHEVLQQGSHTPQPFSICADDDQGEFMCLKALHTPQAYKRTGKTKAVFLAVLADMREIGFHGLNPQTL
eukprot:g4695.t1